MTDRTNSDAFALASASCPTIASLDPESKSLGLQAKIWHGDDLPRRVGGPPAGYVTKTYMTEWNRGDNPGYMQFGPYFEPATVGAIVSIRWLMSLSNRGADGDDVLSVDVVDHNAGRELIPTRTFKVRDFCRTSDGFIVFTTREIEINPSMSIESRIKVHGGASVALYQLRYDVHYL